MKIEYKTKFEEFTELLEFAKNSSQSIKCISITREENNEIGNEILNDKHEYIPVYLDEFENNDSYFSGYNSYSLKKEINGITIKVTEK